MKDRFYDLVGKVEDTLSRNGFQLIIGESGPFVRILYHGPYRYYRISFTSRSADGTIVIEEPIEIYAGLKSEPYLIEQNDAIVSRLEQKLMSFNKIWH